ncbi:MAG: N-acetyltransferase [Humidesulfovibrio sp.]|uniref:N-acetyltransferase n=1 Tax=Humidesulfovibrio sp. TaxID=2910988 RepID=UPI0027F0014C|nr:N-acetyltransferase [Humidesulfovibrio sp.]MDQ7835664.1 N-acetyltransferase [Humidesulfovibrio sp.]
MSAPVAHQLRKARITDVKGIHKLLMTTSGDDGLVLPRSFNQLYSHLRDFFVIASGEDDSVLACCALSISWENLAEVRSLVVAREQRGQGLARKLVEACVSDAVTLGIYRVFALTNTVAFFEHMGFSETSKDSLPQKVWSDCLNCPRFPDCDEIAMIMEL